jgi:hypothetical protein
MGFLKLFSKQLPASLLRLPTGSFTLDRSGRVVVTTLPSSFPTELVSEVGESILSLFRDAHEAQLPLEELVVYYPALKLTARELRGGAIVYLTPQTLTNPFKQP